MDLSTTGDGLAQIWDLLWSLLHSAPLLVPHQYTREGKLHHYQFFFSPKSPKLHREVVLISSQCSQPHQGPKNTKPSYLLQLMQVSCSGEKTKSTRGKKQNYLWEKALDHIGKETTDCFLFAVLILIIFINCRSYWGLSQINSVMRT